MVIDFLNQGPKTYDSFEELFNEYYVKIFKELHLRGEFITDVTIVDNKTVHKINREYRNVDKPTDVISFAFLDNEDRAKEYASGMPVILGDIYISLDKADEQAKEYGHSMKRELCFLFVHGLLHLLGYDHMTKEDEEIMFPLQDKILEGETF